MSLTAPPAVDRRFRAWLYAATTALAVVLFSIAVPLGATIYGVHLIAMFAIGIASCGAMPLAVRTPWLAGLVFAVSANVFAGLSASAEGAPWPWPVTTIIGGGAMLAVVGLTRPWWHGLIVWGAVAFTLAPYGLVSYGAAANAIIGAAITLLSLAFAILIAGRRTIARELFREREQTAKIDERRAVVEERNRIARELHDVVAHGLSLIQVRATSAPYRLEGLSAETSEEFTEIARQARTAMGEMRQLLGVLRSEDAEAPTAPQPGIAEIGELIDSVEGTGVRVERRIDDGLPEGGILSSAIYRIVQESLSNVVRHAPGTTASVAVERRESGIVVAVENAAPPARTGEPAEARGGGHGLIGMRERAAALDGQVEYGETADGGFRVLAVLPDASPQTAPTGAVSDAGATRNGEA